MKEFITDPKQEVQAASAQKAQTPDGFQGKVLKDSVRGWGGVGVQLMNIVGN